jgi:hypothetical protein
MSMGTATWGSDQHMHVVGPYNPGKQVIEAFLTLSNHNGTRYQEAMIESSESVAGSRVHT